MNTQDWIDRTMLKPVLPLLLSMLLAGCSLLGIRSDYEQPPYEITGFVGDAVEIRRYGPRLAAESVVDAAERDADGNAAFRALFDYISGANRTRESIAMTAPVATDSGGAEIAMTAPVETDADAAGRFRMRFFLPAAYTAESVPQPTDPQVRIVAVPAATMAVLRYTGWRDEAEVADRKGQLLAALSSSSWRSAGEPVAYFYDPPWTIPFLRRNEVAVPVTAR